jgi:hypothetical protein
MSARDDLEQAAASARAQVDEARSALAELRAAAGGGPAGSAREAEAQLRTLRTALERDVTTLRERATVTSVTAPGPVRTAAIVAGAGLLAVVGAGVLGRRGLERARSRRRIEQQAHALADALARRASDGGAGGSHRQRDGRGGRGALVVALAGAAVAAGIGIVRERRSRPIDPDELWLPERPERGA